MHQTDELTTALVEYAEEMIGSLRNGSAKVITLPGEKWRRGQDGTFRPEVESRTITVPPTNGEPSPALVRARSAVANDEEFGPYVGGMVGTIMSTSGFSEDTVVDYTVDSSILADDGGEGLAGRIASRLRQLRQYFRDESRASILLLPIPGLTSQVFPIEIEEGLEIDSFTEEEVEACTMTGVLQPIHHGYRILGADECVGVRAHIAVPARRLKPGEDVMLAPRPEELSSQHRFGTRSPWKWSDLVEDVLFLLRVSSPAKVMTRGGVLVTSSLLGGTSMSWGSRAVPSSFVHSNLEIDATSATKLSNRWAQLSRQGRSGKSLPSICMRRFNTATDRNAIEDSIVDHLIAAEALFLKGVGQPEDRGELGFRLSLRAALMLEKVGRARRETFKFMKRAYDLRSKISHGGSPSEKDWTVGGRSYSPNEFVVELGAIMSDALRLASDEYDQTRNFGTAEYWDVLTLGQPTDRED